MLESRMTLAVLMLLALPANAVTLQGSTTLVGDRTGVARVTLPQSSTLVFDAIADVVGPGRFVGFVLTPDPLPTFSDPPIPIFGAVLMAGLADGSWRFGNMIGQPQLEAGNYLLYLLADGAPARVTLHFEGLTGQVDVPTGGVVRYEVSFLDPVITAEPTRSVYSAGSGGSLYGPGVIFTGLWLLGPEIQGQTTGNSGAYGYCLYNLDSGTPPPDPGVAYLPGCPWQSQSSGSGTFQNIQEPGANGVWLGVTSLLYENSWGQGAWYATASLVEESGSVGFWLTLDAPGDPPIATQARSWAHVKATYRTR